MRKFNGGEEQYHTETTISFSVEGQKEAWLEQARERLMRRTMEEFTQLFSLKQEVSMEPDFMDPNLRGLVRLSFYVIGELYD